MALRSVKRRSAKGAQVGLLRKLVEADQLAHGGQLLKARQRYEAVIEAAQAQTERSIEVMARSMMAFCALRAKRLEEAALELEGARPLLASADTVAVGRFLGVEGRLAMAVEEPVKAEDLLQAFSQWALQEEAWEAYLDAALLLAKLLAPEGRVVVLEQALQRAERARLVRGMGAAHGAMAAALMELGQEREALGHYVRSRDAWLKAGTPRDAMGAAWALGNHAGRLRELPLAQEALEQAVSLGEAEVDLLPYVLLDLARVVLARGETGAATVLARRAAAAGTEQETTLPRFWRDLAALSATLGLA